MEAIAIVQGYTALGIGIIISPFFFSCCDYNNERD